MSIDSDMSKSKNTFKENQIQAEIRFLLCLWDLGTANKEVKRSVLNKRIVRKHEKSTDYEKIISELEKEGAIAISKNGFSLVSPKGLEVLGEGLKSPDFKFEGTIVGTWVANALLKWISKSQNAVVVASVSSNGNGNGNGKKTQIQSYEEFKLQTLGLFKNLNETHCYSGLVPIWHLRQELSEQVSREDFNDWMITMQREQLFYLQSGEARGATDEQKKNSINNEIRGLLFFASKP